MTDPDIVPPAMGLAAAAKMAAAMDLPRRPSLGWYAFDARHLVAHHLGPGFDPVDALLGSCHDPDDLVRSAAAAVRLVAVDYRRETSDARSLGILPTRVRRVYRWRPTGGIAGAGRWVRDRKARRGR